MKKTGLKLVTGKGTNLMSGISISGQDEDVTSLFVISSFNTSKEKTFNNCVKAELKKYGFNVRLTQDCWRSRKRTHYEKLHTALEAGREADFVLMMFDGQEIDQVSAYLSGRLHESGQGVIGINAFTIQPEPMSTTGSLPSVYDFLVANTFNVSVAQGLSGMTKQIVDVISNKMMPEFDPSA